MILIFKVMYVALFTYTHLGWAINPDIVFTSDQNVLAIVVTSNNSDLYLS